jgi:hypothetical protein
MMAVDAALSSASGVDGSCTVGVAVRVALLLLLLLLVSAVLALELAGDLATAVMWINPRPCVETRCLSLVTAAG